MKEKTVTLDIARRVYAMLKKNGYRVFLTRNDDTQLSVLDRFQLAQQLKADLFVSVHVNAVPAIPGRKSVSGVETYFLDGKHFFGKDKTCCFLFDKTPKDKVLAHLAKGLLYNKISESKALSNLIQTSVLSRLKQKKISVVNRGVKRAPFRVLRRNEVPSSLVEVGFITNKDEARRMRKATYRNFLAQGICDGIKKFLAS